MKRLALFCDGTWNIPDKQDRGRRKPSNVVKMVRAVRPLAADDVVQLSGERSGRRVGWRRFPPRFRDPVGTRPELA